VYTSAYAKAVAATPGYGRCRHLVADADVPGWAHKRDPASGSSARPTAQG